MLVTREFRHAAPLVRIRGAAFTALGAPIGGIMVDGPRSPAAALPMPAMKD